jgi:hypothetical protein
MEHQKDLSTAEFVKEGQKQGGHTKKHKPLPPLSLLKDFFEVSKTSESGLVWRIKRKGRNPGDTAGTKRPSGHWQVKINNQLYGVHRIIFYLETGCNPGNYIVDHIKGTDYPLELRMATSSQNRCNSKSSQTKNRTSRYKGVYWSSKDKRWGTSIMINGKRIYKTYLKTETEAALKYNELAIKHHGEFAVLKII